MSSDLQKKVEDGEQGQGNELWMTRRLMAGIL